MRRITRIIAITSINQLIVGLACLEKNKKENNSYNDYMIINNILLSNDAVKSIKNTSKHFKFKKIIDFRKRLKWFNNWRNHSTGKYNNILPAKIRMFVQLFINYKVEYYKSIKTITNDLIALIGSDSVDELYFRYKFNLPEQLLLHAFPSADIYLFEDGLGDYIPKTNFEKVEKLSFEKQIVIRIKQIIHDYIRKDKTNPLKIDLSVYKRIKGIYELINNCEGWKKRLLVNNVPHEPIGIKNYYINILMELKTGVFLDINNDGSIILLPSNYSAGKLWYPDKKWCSIDEEIIYIDQIIQSIEKLYPNNKIILKIHPRSPKYISELYENNFGNKLKILHSSDYPGEILFLNNNVKAVVGGFSTSLIYSKNIFNLETYFAPVPGNGSTWFADQTKIELIENTLINLGIKKLALN